MIPGRVDVTIFEFARPLVLPHGGCIHFRQPSQLGILRRTRIPCNFRRDFENITRRPSPQLQCKFAEWRLSCGFPFRYFNVGNSFDLTPIDRTLLTVDLFGGILE